MSWNYGQIRYDAKRIEKSESALFNLGPVSEAQVGAILLNGECRSHIVKPAVTAVLADLDGVAQDLSVSEKNRKFQFAQNFVDHALTCLPTSGNLWLRSAMVRSAMAGDTEAVTGALILSQLLSPSERDALSGRYALYERLSETTLGRSREPLSGDLRIFCSSPPTRGLAISVLQSSSHALRTLSEVQLRCRRSP